MSAEARQDLQEDRAIQQFEMARDLLSRLYVLIRTAKSYDRSNCAVLETAQALHAAVLELLDECTAVRFDVVNDCVFFNRVRIRAKISGFNTIRYFVEETKTRGVRSLLFDETVEVDDLVSFAMVFSQLDPQAASPFQEMVRRMELEGISGIEIRPLKKGQEETATEAQKLPTKEEAKRSFFSALHIVKEAVQDGVTKGTVNPRKVKRVVESVVDSILSDEESMMALTAIKDYDEYTYHHSFNVCIYSIALGNRLGLPRQALCEVGIAALFHDVGKTDVPRETLNKTENLTDDDWKTIQEHTMSGVKVLTYLKRMERSILRAMIVAFCHHLNIDRTGYPQTPSTVKPDAFSRIVRIADVYDALTSARSYRMRPFSRSEALAVITEKAGVQLDPTLCAVFADVVGGLPDNLDAAEQLDDLGGLAGPPGRDCRMPGQGSRAAETWDFPDDPMPEDPGQGEAGSCGETLPADFLSEDRDRP